MSFTACALTMRPLRVLWLLSLFALLRVSRFPSSVMKQAEDRRNEDKCCHGCAEQAANHGAAQRSILLATVAEPQSHRDHADDHGERRHANRSKTCCARFDGREDGIAVLC